MNPMHADLLPKFYRDRYCPASIRLFESGTSVAKAIFHFSLLVHGVRLMKSDGAAGSAAPGQE